MCVAPVSHLHGTHAWWAPPRHAQPLLGTSRATHARDAVSRYVLLFHLLCCAALLLALLLLVCCCCSLACSCSSATVCDIGRASREDRGRTSTLTAVSLSVLPAGVIECLPPGVITFIAIHSIHHISKNRARRANYRSRETRPWRGRWYRSQARSSQGRGARRGRGRHQRATGHSHLPPRALFFHEDATQVRHTSFFRATKFNS